MPAANHAKAFLEGTMLHIEYNDGAGGVERTRIDTTEMKRKKRYVWDSELSGRLEKHQILLTQKNHQTDEIVVVAFFAKKICYWKWPDDGTSPYKHLVTVRSKVLRLRLTKRQLKINYACVVQNPFKLSVQAEGMYLDEYNQRTAAIKVVPEAPSIASIFKNHLYAHTFTVKELLMSGDVPINSFFRIKLVIDGKSATYNLYKKNKRIKNRQFYYEPIVCRQIGDFAVNLRRTSKGGVVLMRRRLEPIEYTRWFRFIESRAVSMPLYYTAKVVRALNPKPVNIYFEKFSSKAEEGTFEVFTEARNSSRSSNYFLLRQTALDYARLRTHPGVVRSFSFKSYWLLYRANHSITTEAPAHAHLLRSNNRYIRRAVYGQKFIFLQHGIIYMKYLGQNTAFVAGREAEPDLIVVASDKERRVTADMLNLPIERVIKTGQPLFDKIDYGHITESSDDIVTVMLTWKPYEEHIQDFSTSSYYQNTVAIYTRLSQFLPHDNIQIVAHPKALPSLRRTDLNDRIWDRPISEALKQTKLMITDYSSVCYNSFYQGSAVIFYQPDLALYEAMNGPLIPSDSEYVGNRVYSEQELEVVLNSAIEGERIRLATLRTPQHEKNYEQINEFHDGQNIARLQKALISARII